MSPLEQLELSRRLTKVLEAMGKLELERQGIVRKLVDGNGSDLPVVTRSEPEEPKQTADEAMAVYEAALPKITEAQGRMIFALLTNNHAIIADEDKKAVIRGIVKEEHGVEIESTKELSKVWAGDVITYIQKATTDELKKFWKKEEPF